MANLSDAPLARTPLERGDLVYDSTPLDGSTAPPWSVQVSLERS